MVVKHCAYGNCKSDSRYVGKDFMKDVFFIKFPPPVKQKERCEKWVAACGREYFTLRNVTKFTYMCSKHFIGGNGPTRLSPDPLPRCASRSPSKIRVRSTKRSLEAADENKEQVCSRKCDGSLNFAAGSPQKDTAAYSERELEAAQILTSISSCALEISTGKAPEGAQESDFLEANETTISLKEVATQTYRVADTVAVRTDRSTQTHLECGTDTASLNVFKDSLERGIQTLCTKNWTFSFTQEVLKVFKIEKHIAIVEITVDITTKIYTVHVLGKQLILNKHGFSSKIQSLGEVVSVIGKLDNLKVCMGIAKKDLIQNYNSNSRKAHICSYTHSVRSNECMLLCKTPKGPKCINCKLYESTLRKAATRQFVTVQSKLNLKRKVIYRLKQQSRRMKLKLQRLISKCKTFPLEGNDLETFRNILEEKCKKAEDKNSFFFFFLKEQLRMSQKRDPHGNRWHPLLLKWCTYMYHRSASTYEALQQSGFLCLPSKSTLYRHLDIKTTTGFSSAATEEIVENLGSEEHQKYVCLVHDEMSINSDIVYNKHTGEIVGFVQLNDFGNELREIENKIAHGLYTHDNEQLATHMLVLFIRGITSGLKQSFACFPVQNLSAVELHSILWEAIEYLEGAGVRVLGITSDGAGINRKLYRLNAMPGMEFPYKTVNPFASDECRPLFFISDVPHLLKTLRNCFSNSNFHQKSRRLWKNNMEILWTHIVELYEHEVKNAFQMAFKLSFEHVYLTSFSKMRVRLAAQVLSDTVASSMENLLGEKTRETVVFVRKCNKWFDVMNSRNLNEGIYKRKENILPFTQVTDARLKWLTEDFLQYFKQWRMEVQSRPGNFTKEQRKRMFISEETFEGLGITVCSTVEIVKFMLEKGAKFVLTAHLNQDPLELEFGLQRASGGANENPSVKQFLQNSNKIKSIRQHLRNCKKGNITIS